MGTISCYINTLLSVVTCLVRIQALSPESNPDLVHEVFGESWRAPKEDWLFDQFLSGMVEADMTDGPVHYNYSLPEDEILEMYSDVRPSHQKIWALNLTRLTEYK